MTIDFGNPNRPNSYIGRTVPRPNARRLVEGRGRYVDDITLPRMLHVAFVRSPHAHAKIDSIDIATAKSAPGVRRVFIGADIAKHCSPWVAVLAHLKGLKSAPQNALAIDRVTWTGEAVVAVVADSRVAAEDGATLVEVDYTPLPVVADMRMGLDLKTPLIHPELGDNLSFHRKHEKGEVDAVFASAYKIIEASFKTGRHTGVTLEPRSILSTTPLKHRT
jgi:carbon-monoxide dehydrogenase large subunit